MPDSKLSVVLVDDSRSVLLHLESLIEEMDGVSVVGTAHSGAAALGVVTRSRPDLVLLDIVMPEMDGLAALRLIRANHPDVRVAMLSSVGGTASRAEEAFRLGAVQVLGKPVETDQLEAFFESERARRAEGTS